MDLNEQKDDLYTTEIPKVFKTFISEEYFSNCIACDKYLLDNKTYYFIEKAVKDGHIEVEYAMCMECIENMRDRMSEESMERINKYFEQNFDFFKKRYNILKCQNSCIDDFISSCIFKDKSINELDEYQIMGHCRGKKLMLSIFPYMVSKEAIEEVQELLSAKTKEELDDFTNRFFSLPPELKEIIRNKKLILL